MPRKTPSKKKAAAAGRKKKRTESFSMYIYKVLKQVHPDTGTLLTVLLTPNTLVISNHILSWACYRVASSRPSLLVPLLPDHRHGLLGVQHSVRPEPGQEQRLTRLQVHLHAVPSPLPLEPRVLHHTQKDQIGQKSSQDQRFMAAR